MAVDKPQKEASPEADPGSTLILGKYTVSFRLPACGGAMAA